MKQHQVSPTVRPYGRLKLIGGGLALAIVGSTLLLRGVQVVTHRNHTLRIGTEPSAY